MKDNVYLQFQYLKSCCQLGYKKKKRRKIQEEPISTDKYSNKFVTLHNSRLLQAINNTKIKDKTNEKEILQKE